MEAEVTARGAGTHNYDIFTHQVFLMRTNIEIDDALMRQAMRSSGAKTKKATVEEALRLLVQLRAQSAIRRWKGKIKWEGNLEESRRGRFPV